MIRLALTFLALVVLAIVSWVLADAGAPTVVALVIAAVKAILIGLVFMELSHAHIVPRTIAIVMILFIALLISGVMTDVDLRR
jgi:caa(3)-type oxidase subunit IV